MLAELRIYLAVELKLSEEAATKRTERIRTFLQSIGTPIDYPLCRFKRWSALGYRCTVFEKDWVFAYEIAPQGIIIRDMSHVKLLTR
jgi:hypothetical protein